MTAAAPAAVPHPHEVIEVGAEDLPVFCPGPKACLLYTSDAADE